MEGLCPRLLLADDPINSRPKTFQKPTPTEYLLMKKNCCSNFEFHDGMTSYVVFCSMTFANIKSALKKIVNPLADYDSI